MSIDHIVYDKRVIDGDMGHQDDRRKLISAYNGEFLAEVVQSIHSVTGAQLKYGDSSWGQLLFILEGSAQVQVGQNSYTLKAQETSWDRLILPPHERYDIEISPGSTVVKASERNEPRYCSLDGQVTFMNLFYHERSGFSAAQLKFLMPFDKDVVLGGHYHDYGEAYSMLRGNCIFRFEDIETLARDQKEIEAIDGSHLVIPSRKAHTAKVAARSILVGCTQDSFSRENDSAKPYSNEWLKFKE